MPDEDRFVRERQGRVPSAELLEWLSSLPSGEREQAVEERLGIAVGAASTPPGKHLVGYHASGLAAIVRALIEAPVTPEDVFVDIGSGLGKVVLLAALITGARARGIEMQGPLVEQAREAARRLGVEASFSEEDACEANLDDGTVFFLYLPFTGPVLARVVDRLRAVADRHAIVVCTLGVSLPSAPWLVRREVESFWLDVYDGAGPGVAPRSVKPGGHSLQAEIVAFERPATSQDPSRTTASGGAT